MRDACICIQGSISEAEGALLTISACSRALAASIGFATTGSSAVRQQASGQKVRKPVLFRAKGNLSVYLPRPRQQQLKLQTLSCPGRRYVSR